MLSRRPVGEREAPLVSRALGLTQYILHFAFYIPLHTLSSATFRQVAHRGATFGVSDADADDFYDVVVSSEDEEEDSDDEQQPTEPAMPQDTVSQVATMMTTSLTVSRSVMKPIGTISFVEEDSVAGLERGARSAPVFSDEFKLSESQLQQHSQRRTALEAALDAASGSGMSDGPTGEAPFHFAAHRGKPVMSPAPTDVAIPMPSSAPQQTEGMKRRPSHSSSRIDEESDEEGLEVEADPLYDDARDDADEKWVQRNLRGAGASTDAALCCPCCFVTVCMDCERHVNYHNQYRARIAMNCRVNKDEVLTYASAQSRQSSPDEKLSSMSRRQSSSAARLLQANEYYGVACSDCGTTVGVYDAQQFYHFFNVLPSHS